jgi:hypothetical protein
LLKCIFYVISGFRHDVDEICALLGNYAVCSDNSLPTFRHNLSVPSSRARSLHNFPEERRSRDMSFVSEVPLDERLNRALKQDSTVLHIRLSLALTS